MNIGQRRTITAWWIFRQQEYIIKTTFRNPTPQLIEDWITEAEDDLEKCDLVLQEEFEEYIPQYKDRRGER